MNLENGFPPPGCGGCDTIRWCANWCAKLGSRRPTSCCRCSCGLAASVKQEIGSMPGHFQWSPDRVGRGNSHDRRSRTRRRAAVRHSGQERCARQRFVQRRRHRAAGDSRRQTGRAELLVMTDVCFCEYTDHGHCGVLNEKTGRMDVDNDATLELLAQASRQPRPGRRRYGRPQRHDGRHGRRDSRAGSIDAGFAHVPIMSYAAKYASAFYGPFREAAESAPQFGDRRSYQMDPAAAAGSGAARSGTRSGRRGRHRDGQAGAGLSGHHPRRARPRFPACRWRLTTCRASTAWSRPPPHAAGSTRKRSRWNR